MSAQEIASEDGAIRLDPITPKTAMPPTRGSLGEQIMGRMVTTEEQRREVLTLVRIKVEALLEQLRPEPRHVDVEVEVHWGDKQVAMMRARYSIEHTDDGHGKDISVACLEAWQDGRDGVGDLARRRFLEMSDEARRIHAANGLKGRG